MFVLSKLQEGGGWAFGNTQLAGWVVNPVDRAANCIDRRGLGSICCT